MDQILALVSYVIITTFTPGPNNLTATSSGLKNGYKRTLPYLFGIALGFFVVMLLSGFLNLIIGAHFSVIKTILKWVGFIYLLYLAINPFIHSSTETKEPTFTFTSGFILQVFNPKVILFGITTYSLFSNILLSKSIIIFSSSLIFTVVCFTAISLWCILGSIFSSYLNTKKRRLILDIILAILLVLTAISIIFEK